MQVWHADCDTVIVRNIVVCTYKDFSSTCDVLFFQKKKKKKQQFISYNYFVKLIENTCRRGNFNEKPYVLFRARNTRERI